MKKNILKNNGVQSLLASLVCVILGLLIGYIVLLFINPDGAGEAITDVMKNFLTYSKPIRISPPAPERWRRPAKNLSAGSTRRKWRRFKAVRVDFWPRYYYNCVVAFVRRLSCAAAAGRSR